MLHSTDFLAGKILIAMPNLMDTFFNRAVILICQHDAQGTVGLIINKPLPSITLKDLLENLHITPSQESQEIKIFFGGPVEKQRGFVIHSTDYSQSSTVKITDNLALTANAEILEALAKGKGPKESFLAIGYAGWGPGQLNQELLTNNWIITEADAEILFNISPENKWHQSLARAGISPEMLLSEDGHA